MRSAPEMFIPDSITVAADELEKLISAFGEDFSEELTELAEDAARIAKPKALWCAALIDSIEGDAVHIGDVAFTSTLMAEKFASAGRVFPYICTCGSELEEWSRSLDDPFFEYFTDELKKIYLGKTMAVFYKYLREKFEITGPMTALNPGSVKEWPLCEQNKLFDLFGREYILENIGVTLTDSCLMLPSKTVDGIYFANAEGFENCEICPIEGCPNRRKARKEI